MHNSRCFHPWQICRPPSPVWYSEFHVTGRSEGFFRIRKFWQVFLVGILFGTENYGKNRGEKKIVALLGV